MIYKKKSNQIQGLWCRKDKTFYYLETGVHSVRNPLDRIRSTLITKGLVDIDITGIRLHEEPLLKMTMAEAEERDYQVEAIYLNPHVRAQVEASKNGGHKPASNPWK